MHDGISKIPLPKNEPILSYAKGNAEREALKAALAKMAGEVAEVPVVIGGERIHTGDMRSVTMPHKHAHEIAKVHCASEAHVQQAIESALKASQSWQQMPFDQRAAIFLRAADMLTGPWRQRINASCMLGQSKTCYQSEIDAVCELADFLRYNVAFARQIMEEQPDSAPGIWNRTDYRPLEGFILAVTPFNFLSIAVNLCAAPALMGNVVLWKPSTTSALGAWHCLQMLEEAGLPKGVIQLIPGDGPTQGTAALNSPHLAGIHFTGSTGTFRHLYRGVAERIDKFRSYPRIVGETGGKDFVLAHPSANIDQLRTALVRGAFEYQGQKCSAASRAYIPQSLWKTLRAQVAEETKKLKVGDVSDFSNFLGAVIDERAHKKISGYIAQGKETASLVVGGATPSDTGWFIDPTIFEVTDPKHTLMCEEIFGPVLTVYPYEDNKWDDMFDVVDQTSPYALTGAVFATDRYALTEASSRLRHSAGNFYLNDKPTGAVVGQQPFGGGRASGTNDKAGAPWNLLRWVSPRSIKENLCPPTDWRYPFHQ